MLLHFDFLFVEFFRMLCMYFQPDGILYIAVTMEDMIIIDREIFTVGVPSHRNVWEICFQLPQSLDDWSILKVADFPGSPTRPACLWRNRIGDGQYKIGGWMDAWINGWMEESLSYYSYRERRPGERWRLWLRRERCVRWRNRRRWNPISRRGSSTCKRVRLLPGQSDRRRRNNPAGENQKNKKQKWLIHRILIFQLNFEI